LRLLGVVEEAEHALHEQRRRALVVVGQAVVGEEAPIAGVHEQLCALGCLGELVGDVEIARSEDNPSAATVWIWSGTRCGQGGRSRGAAQPWSSKAPLAPGRVWAGITASEKPAWTISVGKLSAAKSSALDARSKPTRGGGNAVGERGEGLAVVEIGGVNDVSSSRGAHRRSRRHPGRQSLCALYNGRREAVRKRLEILR
jgi:hypothetical protein